MGAATNPGCLCGCTTTDVDQPSRIFRGLAVAIPFSVIFTAAATSGWWAS